MKEKEAIAFFDSGVGGLTVMYDALSHLPHERIIYFADSDHVPYGTKSINEIRQFVREAVAFLVKQNIKALVVACNTATSAIINELRQEYNFPIIGMEPAVKPASELGQKKILLCATERTLQEEKLNKLILELKLEKRLTKCSLQGLVTFAEDLDFESDDVRQYINKQFESYDLAEYDTLVLGCTHFIYFKKVLEEILPGHIQLIDGNLGTVNRLVELVKLELNSYGDQKILYFSSANVVSSLQFERYLERLKSIE